MKKIVKVTGPGMPLLLDDIDTDRIIPARYLRCVTFDGLGDHVFKDDREQHGDHVFDRDHHQEAKVLVAGRNFGCGSSREHAPQALLRWGIEAIIAESFAEIFHGNCTALGIPCVHATPEQLKQINAAVEADPTLHLTVCLETSTVTHGDTKHDCHVHEGTRTALVSGQWDYLGELLEGEPQIRETASQLPYVTNFA
ncbi:3-isopropylmalate dehydratase small subunit [Symmachiella dynata]|uniref:3-isopropylmalate dehydratase small subunit n=1 Tax=Symmachiella dynata TaxID=2527995 RepID=UPI00118989E3|nr:3-isopropylmalate dehydratase small subunit [Symmachiella dynata]QDT48044.1 3-isopropylmalate dehydratase small subunit [Symmachiella dynata]